MVLGTPIPLHAQMIDEAFAAGASVLVEKPPVVTVQDLDRLLARQGSGDSGGPLCQVGFQNARAPVVRALARLARDGALGEVEHVGLVGRWSRADSYYTRTDWAGRLVHHGRYVLDGTLTNPFAHGLMNALIVAGDHDDAPATPTTVRAELYRCRDSIDGDDTASVRIRPPRAAPSSRRSRCARRRRSRRTCSFGAPGSPPGRTTRPENSPWTPRGRPPARRGRAGS